MAIKAVLWDVDGTLVDTEPLHLAKFVGVAKNNGITLNDDEIEAMRGVADKGVWKYLKAAKGLKISLDDFYDECYDYYMDHPEEIVPRDGAKDAFNHFASKEIPQAAVSSGIRIAVDHSLSQSGVDDQMLFSLSADDVGETKPHPLPYLSGKAVMCYGLDWDNDTTDAADFVAVEDSPAGVMAAKLAGLTTIYWPQHAGKTSKYADYTVETADELMELVKALTSPQGATPAPKTEEKRDVPPKPYRPKW